MNQIKNQQNQARRSILIKGLMNCLIIFVLANIIFIACHLGDGLLIKLEASMLPFYDWFLFSPLLMIFGILIMLLGIIPGTVTVIISIPQINSWRELLNLLYFGGYCLIYLGTIIFFIKRQHFSRTLQIIVWSVILGVAGWIGSQVRA